ncbi:MAG: hypothetical protein KDI48_01845 [Xanthomonadales bacterium]|nr:hypothetical protein [Xanthomonadales bacterium]
MTHPSLAVRAATALRLRDRLLALPLAIATLSIGFVLPLQAQADSTQAQAASVQMYVLPNCGYCERARQHLRARGVAFEEFDIAASAEHKARFVALGGQGTPLLQVGAQVLHGFDPPRLDAALAALPPAQ